MNWLLNPYIMVPWGIGVSFIAVMMYAMIAISLGAWKNK